MEDLPDQPPRLSGHGEGWTEAEVEMLKRCCEHGLSASQIGIIMGRTRNAVIGKIGRVTGVALTPQKTGRAPRPSRGQGLRKPRVNWSAKHAGPPTDRVAVLQAATQRAQDSANQGPPQMRGISLLDLGTHDCRWPVGHVGAGDFGFCATPQLVGTPYCCYHARLAYQHGATRRP